MGKKHRLSPLQVSVAGHDHAPPPLCAGEQHLHEVEDPLEMADNGLTQVELDVEGNLIVAAAARVHLAPDRAHQFGETPLHGHVHVLVVQVPGEGPVCHLAATRSSPSSRRDTSSDVSVPMLPSMRTCALEPSRSCGAST